eukprot:IDg8051t1
MEQISDSSLVDVLDFDNTGGLLRYCANLEVAHVDCTWYKELVTNAVLMQTLWNTTCAPQNLNAMRAERFLGELTGYSSR